MSNSRAFQKYNKYNHWWAKIEKRLIIICLLLFLVLYASQFMNFMVMQKGGSLLTAQIEKLEGKAISNSQTNINTGNIELSVISNSDFRNIQIYLNGEYYTNFNQKSITLTVKNNDIIELCGIKNEFPAKIKITGLSDNISGVKLDETMIVSKGFVKVGRIRLK